MKRKFTFSISKLNNIVIRSPNSTIVSDHSRLHSWFKFRQEFISQYKMKIWWSLKLNFHKSTLNISSRSCFNSRIDQSFTPSHSVEEKFCWRQTSQVWIFNEPLRLRWKIVFHEAGKRSMVKMKWDSFSGYILLPNDRDNLGNVDFRTFRSGNNLKYK